MSSSTTRFILLASCIVTLITLTHPTESLLLGNFIGCNSFGCRLSALESDVALLKQQMARLDPSGQLQQGMNNFQRPNNMQPFNQNMGTFTNQNMNPQQQQQLQQQQMNGQMLVNSSRPSVRQVDDGRVNYNLDYPLVNNQNLLRNPGYLNSFSNGQFMNV